MRVTASRGVQCSPASSLFSSLKRRTSSSKIEPMPWLSRPGCLTGAVGVEDRSRAEVDVGRGELLDQRAQGVGFGQARNLVAELEVVEDVLYVGRKPVQVGFKIGSKLLATGAGSEVAQGELRGVVERLSCCLSQGRVLFDYARRVEGGLHVKDGPACCLPGPHPAGAVRSWAGSRHDTCRARTGRAARRRQCPQM